MSSSLSELYDRADALHQLAPWQWMQEIQPVALRHPVLQETAYLSMMGAAGSRRSLTVYLNEESLHRFNLTHSEQSLDLDPDDQIGLIMESRQLQVSFESRGELETHNLAQVKSLGRKYRGQAYRHPYHQRANLQASGKREQGAACTGPSSRRASPA